MRVAKVLVLEPSADVRDLFVLLLGRLGHETTVSEDGVDVVVVENADPDAFDTALDLRKRRPELPVVCASIEPRTPNVDPLEPAAYLVKPFSISQLDAALRRALPPD